MLSHLIRTTRPYVFSAIALASGVATAELQGAPADNPTAAPAITVGTGVDINPFGAVDAFLLVESTGRQWKIVEIGDKPPKMADPGIQELLVIGKNFGYVEPYFREYYIYEKKQIGSDPKKSAPVDPYVCFTGEKAMRPRYNPCDSKLTHTSDRGKSFLGNLMIVLSSDPASLKNGSGFAVSVDRDRILALLADTNAIDAAKRYVRQTAFERADTVEKVRAFIQKYRNDNPDGLVQRAEARIPEIQKAESERQLAEYRSQFPAAKTSADFRAFLERYESNDPDRLIPKATQGLKSAELEEHRQAIEKEERARKAVAAEAEHRRREIAALAAWRGRLKIGDDTFCGPVIELRQPMIKIAVRAQLPGYPSEAWLKAGEIFPADAGCSNINGQLTPAYR